MKIVFCIIFLAIAGLSQAQTTKDTAQVKKQARIVSIEPDKSHFRYFAESIEVAKVSGMDRDTLSIVLESIYQYRYGIRYIKIGDRLYELRQSKKRNKSNLNKLP